MASIGNLGRGAALAGRLASSRITPVSRRMSSDVKPASPPKPARRGSSLFQRLTAFLAGAGIGCGIGYYHLAKEIKGSTAALEAALEKSHRDLDSRLKKLEKR